MKLLTHLKRFVLIESVRNLWRRPTSTSEPIIDCQQNPIVEKVVPDTSEHYAFSPAEYECLKGTLQAFVNPSAVEDYLGDEDPFEYLDGDQTGFGFSMHIYNPNINDEIGYHSASPFDPPFDADRINMFVRNVSEGVINEATFGLIVSTLAGGMIDAAESSDSGKGHRVALDAMVLLTHFGLRYRRICLVVKLVPDDDLRSIEIIGVKGTIPMLSH